MHGKADRPTDAELEILKILWTHGPTTVRQVFQVLHERRGTGYTTVLKTMQIMAGKRLLHVDRSVRPQVYRPVESRRRTQRKLVTDLLNRAFSGAPGSLIIQLLSTRRATPEERRRIREMLDRLEENAS